MNVEELILAEITSDDFRSGEQISRKLNITRSAVWKHIVKLRDSGYEIEARPHRGYRLLGRPDKLLPAEINPRLETQTVGSRIVHFNRVDSTSDTARQLIERGTAEGTVVIAESQAAGKGRMGRRWITHPGRSIAMSVILFSGLQPASIPLLSLATAVAAARSIWKVTHIRPELKWPNDIYFRGKKLGGVLLEMSAELDRVRWIIDSIGINVNDDLRNTELGKTATSLSAVTGSSVPRLDLVVALLSELDVLWSAAVEEGGMDAYRREFQKLDCLQNRDIRVKTPEGTLAGTARGIDPEGRLLLDGHGTTHAIFSGEATLAG